MTDTARARAEWERHPNIDGPAATLLAIHDQFRAASRRLALMIEREPPQRVRRAFEPLATTLHHHHHAEEAMLFPMVLERTGSAPEQLLSDHEALMSAIAAVDARLSEGDRAKAKAAIASFGELLAIHLDREEALVIPVLLQMTPSEAWARFHGE